MSTSATQLLTAFDALPDGDKDDVVVALLTRRPVGGDALTDDDLTALADDLFQQMDADEGADGTPAG